MDLISPPEEEVLLTKKGTIRKRKPKKSILYLPQILRKQL
jgi:hypothetical protein